MFNQACIFCVILKQTVTVAIDRSGLPARTHKHWRAVRLGFTELKIRDSESGCLSVKQSR
jgi:hypothetical protein